MGRLRLAPATTPLPEIAVNIKTAKFDWCMIKLSATRVASFRFLFNIIGRSTMSPKTSIGISFDRAPAERRVKKKMTSRERRYHNWKCC